MKNKTLILALVLLFAFAGIAKAQDGSEYLLWEKTKDYRIWDTKISNDESQIAIAAEYDYSDTNFIKILNIQNGEELYSTPAFGAWRLFYTTDGRYLVVRCASNLILDAKTYAVIKKFPTGEISFSADNQFLAIAEVKGYSRIVRIYNSNSFEKVFEKEYLPEEADACNIFLFYTPIGDNLIVNAEYLVRQPGPGDQYSRIKTKSDVFDSKTFQLLDKKIKCLSDIFFSTNFKFSNNSLIAKQFGYKDAQNVNHAGFRIYDYEKDSLIWEQETAYVSAMNFIKNTNYLLSTFKEYINDNEWDKKGNIRIWDLEKHVLKVKFPLLGSDGLKLSVNCNYILNASNGISNSYFRLFDFKGIYNNFVSVTDQTTTPSNIEIISNSEKNTISINFLENTNEQTNITLYNLSGNLVDVIYSGIPSGKIEYSTAHLAKGVYLIRIVADNTSSTKKIIVE